MPELPEVETVAQQLVPLVVGRTARKLEIYDPLLKFTEEKKVAGQKITEVFRIGKQIAFRLEGKEKKNSFWLLSHLRMTGRFRVADKYQSTTKREKHLRFQMKLDQGSLLFLDTRRFGTLKLCREYAEMIPVGLEPLSPVFTWKKLKQLLGNTKAEIKPWLLKQEKIVGLGNIYASEILFRSNIHPQRSAGELTDAEIKLIRASTVHILKKAIKNCGTTFSDFQDAHGVTGSYQKLLKVYGNENEPCPKCKNEIKKIVQQQRSTFYCDNCQH